jgi:hypothetical protein
MFVIISNNPTKMFQFCLSAKNSGENSRRKPTKKEKTDALSLTFILLAKSEKPNWIKLSWDRIQVF